MRPLVVVRYPASVLTLVSSDDADIGPGSRRRRGTAARVSFSAALCVIASTPLPPGIHQQRRSNNSNVSCHNTRLSFFNRRMWAPCTGRHILSIFSS
ncbi:hypothetical protein OBBRIDRAFT_435579 [Obba rivulosa]|uniref:Uncharacterized protein n=1 Tax=Obba rivulosa TaxID=1052685 RepID=A0A8E2AY61_9APHY|nr:hypothetical protein OBBRIDRAFT_435579 [Obba rivulosa]